jgi:uncharacterized protein with PhoU and TrkA domain
MQYVRELMRFALLTEPYRFEMKDLSELMIDLAYSAALFNSRPLAEEVIEMERRVDSLAYLLDMSAMIAVRIFMSPRPAT